MKKKGTVGFWYGIGPIVCVLLLLGACAELDGLMGRKQAEDCDPGDAACICERYGQESVNCECARDPAGDACFCGDPANQSSQRCICAADPGRPECRDEAPCPVASTRSLIRDALVRANDGRWDEARRLTSCASDQDPGNRRVQKIKRQLDLGAEYFSTNGMASQGTHEYEVRPGDTLGAIAANCLNDSDLFIALAFFNDIDVPKNLRPGETLATPGTKPCAGAEEYLESALAAERSGDLAEAWRLIGIAADLDDSGIVTDSYTRIRAARAEQLNEEALELLQDDCRAARNKWTAVLDVMPEHQDAKFYLGEIECE